MKDSWQSGDPYEYYMGRWSQLVANRFLEWLSPKSDLQWLDVGCGSGALSAAIVDYCKPDTLIAIDQSEGFVHTTQQRLLEKASCKVGNALSLPLEDAAVDVAVSGLVLNFLPTPSKALAEMQRVTRSGGIIAAYIWDYAGKMEFLRLFWDAAVELDPSATSLHESRRFADSNAEQLLDAFYQIGLAEPSITAIEVATNFSSFDDFWTPFLGGQGPAPTYVSKLSDINREQLRKTLKQRLPIKADGTIQLNARAWAAKCIV